MGNFSAVQIKSGFNDKGRNPTFKKDTLSPAQGAFVEINGVRLPYAQAYPQQAATPAPSVSSPSVDTAISVTDIGNAEQRVTDAMTKQAQYDADRAQSLIDTQDARRAQYQPYQALEQKVRVAKHVAEITGKPQDVKAAEKLTAQRDALGGKIDGAVTREFDLDVRAKVEQQQLKRQRTTAESEATQLRQLAFSRANQEDKSNSVTRMFDNASKLSGVDADLLKKNPKAPEVRVAQNGMLQGSGFAQVTPEVALDTRQAALVPKQYAQALEQKYKYLPSQANAIAQRVQEAMTDAVGVQRDTEARQLSYSDYRESLKQADITAVEDARRVAAGSHKVFVQPIKNIADTESAYKLRVAAERANALQTALARSLSAEGTKFFAQQAQTLTPAYQEFFSAVQASGNITDALQQVPAGELTPVVLAGMQDVMVAALANAPELRNVFGIGSANIRAAFSQASAVLEQQAQDAEAARVDKLLQESASKASKLQVQKGFFRGV